jgi:uncharacterized protein (DUF1697 family)
MKTWIALFRGINVGGKNILPMAELKSDLESLKLKNVRTYIQSGNVVFDSAAKATDALVEKVTRRIEERHGFRPQLILLGHQDLQDAVDANPFPKAVSDPKTLHFSFLATPAIQPDLKALDGMKTPSERFKLIDDVFYLHAPDGIGRSKLAANVEKCLGVVATGRNYRTVDKLLSMLGP